MRSRSSFENRSRAQMGAAAVALEPALAQLSQHLESTPSPHAILPTIAETIAHTLKLPYIEIETQLAHANSTDAPRVTAFGRAPSVSRRSIVPCAWVTA